MSKHISESHPSATSLSPANSISAETLVQEILFSPIGFVLLLCAAAWVWASKGVKTPKKGVLARGRLADRSHEKTAMKSAIAIIQKQKPNEVASWLCTPDGLRVQNFLGKKSLEIPEDPNCVWTIDAEGGTFVLGGPGSGKSYTYIWQQLRSYLTQGCASKNGIPIAFFDYKYSTHSTDEPCPTSQLAGYAIARGYIFHLFAPGLPESGCLNLLDFIQHPEDVEGARQLILILCRSLVPGWNEMIPFFRDGAVSFLTGLCLIAKRTSKPDLLTARTILKVYGILGIVNHPDLPEVVKMVFDQIADIQDNADAYSGIKATVSQLLSTLLMPVIAPSICGESTIPINLDSNIFLSYGVDGQRKDVVLPIISTVIELQAKQNLLRPRTCPYVCSLDEVGQLKIDDLGNWPNVYRSAGLILQLATQSMEALQEKNNEAWAKRLVKGCNTRVVFKLNDHDDAEKFSQACGKEDTTYHTTGSSSGKNSASTSDSEQRQTIMLLESNELTQFTRGKFLLINRGFSDDKGVSIPLIKKVEIPPWDIQAIKESVKAWTNIHSKLRRLKPLDQSDFELRIQASADFFGPDSATLHASSQPPKGKVMTATERLQSCLEVMNIEESLGIKI
jgi:TraM recognition site of TraD and TraG